MTKLALALAAALFASATFAASPAATRDWVRQYVATNVVHVATNAAGHSTWTQGEGRDQVSIALEMPTVFAMVADDCDAVAAAQGITNGTTLVYHRPLAVFAAPNARIWVNVEEDRSYNYVTFGPPAMTSVVYSAATYLTTDLTNRHARIATTYVTPARANAITNGLIIAED